LNCEYTVIGSTFLEKVNFCFVKGCFYTDPDTKCRVYSDCQKIKADGTDNSLRRLYCQSKYTKKIQNCSYIDDNSNCSDPLNDCSYYADPASSKSTYCASLNGGLDKNCEYNSGTNC